ncbi:MAG: XdhC family protein [Negativicutes bacterium]|nr:XdhC family protein [Negativicutes bacterium]
MTVWQFVERSVRQGGNVAINVIVACENRDFLGGIMAESGRERCSWRWPQTDGYQVVSGPAAGGATGLYAADLAGNKCTVWRQIISRGRRRAVIFGGGHVCQALVPLLTAMDFTVTVVDDRDEFVRPDNFPAGTRLIAGDFRRVWSDLDIDAGSSVVIVTRGHLHDRVCLEKALQTGAYYIGMIGSKRKVSMVYRQLLADGADPVRLAGVYAPIGLDIGAETPAEIAVSIAAEIMRVITGRTGISLRDGVKQWISVS